MMEAVRELTGQRCLRVEVERWNASGSAHLKHVPRVPEEGPEGEKSHSQFVGKPFEQVENERASSAGRRRAGCKSRSVI